MLIRPADITDAAAIAVVHVRSWQAAYQGLVPQEFLDRMNPAERQPAWQHQLAETSWPRKGILVAETDGRITGFAGLGPTRDQDQTLATVAEITAIYLQPEAWGTGTGRQLMTAALRTLAQAGYGQATLWVLDTNIRARNFYQAAGRHPDGAIKQDTTRGFPLTQIRYHYIISNNDNGTKTHP